MSYHARHPATDADHTGLDEFVAENDPELADRVTAELDAAIAAIGAIPAPFRDAVLDPDAARAILAAQEAIRAVQATLEQHVVPLIIY
jgi:hypothetical protein